jgi:N-hydroxyarylamine O-acetyltransferase
MNVAAYLDRINYCGSLLPTAQTLAGLQLAHMRAVPFENLSIHSAQPIILDDEALFEKIIARRRGGFCYELNGLFSLLLRNLGFEVQMLSARVANAKGGFGPDFDHMTLLVTLEERWLADVGFGDSFQRPLQLDYRGEQKQGDHDYAIITDGDELIFRQREVGGEWQQQYRFDLLQHTYPDYAQMCLFHQTSPESHFTKGRICTLATESGRITLSELRLITINEGVREERTLRDEAEFATLLREQFGILEQLSFALIVYSFVS